MRLCPVCGAEIADTDQYCPVCGYYFSAENVTEVLKTPPLKLGGDKNTVPNANMPKPPYPPVNQRDPETDTLANPAAGMRKPQPQTGRPQAGAQAAGAKTPNTGVKGHPVPGVDPNTGVKPAG